jgi:hypothetical protein
MSTFLKDVSVIYRRISAVAREYGLPLSLDTEERREQEVVLFPMVVSEVSSPNYAGVMKEYILRGSTGQIRFRMDDYASFRGIAKDCMIRWLLGSFVLPSLRLGSYFLLYRTVQDVSLRVDEKGLYQLSITSDEERYSLNFPFLKSQSFILEELLCDWGVNPQYAYTQEGGLTAKSVASIVGKRFFYLKFFHRFDSVRNRNIFWKYRYISTDVGRLYANFKRGVEKGYVRGYQPGTQERKVLSFFQHTQAHQHSWKVVNKKRLHIYRQNNRAALMIEDRFVAYIDKDSSIYWLGRVSNKVKVIEALKREVSPAKNPIQPSLF